MSVATDICSFIALGSNLGHRERNVLNAVRHLAEMVGPVRALSPLYLTTAVGMQDARAFINAVAVIECPLESQALLETLQGIESRMGRRTGHYESREIDLDIVGIGAAVLDEPGLAVPHPRYAKRAFVLYPLRDVAPDWRCPVSGRSIGELIDGIPTTSGVVRISDRHAVREAA